MATSPTTAPTATHPGLLAGQALLREAGRLPEPEMDPAGTDVAAQAGLIPRAAGDLGAGPLVLRPPLSRMPVELEVGIPIRDFRVRNLLALTPGQLIESDWGQGEDVPLASGAVQVAWTEFEVIESILAVRITRLG